MVLLILLPIIAFASNFLFFKETEYEDILKDMERSRIIYLGEIHDRKDVHELQLRIIRDLYERRHDLLILMEAFQQPFQDALDEYVNGEIGEEDMLSRTEYRKRWRFDPELYAPIWRFAREKGIPLYALNVPTELLREVRKRGIENIKSHYLPRRIMPIREKHRRFLEKALGEHRDIDTKTFFDIQLTWDMGMAYRIAKLTLGNPEKKLVVIVGSGHVWRGYGIPERVNFLIGGISQSVLYVEEDEVYFLFSKDFSKDSSSTNSRREPN